MLDLLQWPAMLVTVAAAWCVASTDESRRKQGFYLYVASNALWSTWGWHTEAWALVALQFALFAMNLRGVKKNREEEQVR
jgi:hypothetical protein